MPFSAVPTTKSCDDSRTVAEDGPVLTAVEMTTPGIRPSYCLLGTTPFISSNNTVNRSFINATVRKICCKEIIELNDNN